MLYEFLIANREELITRCKAKVAKRFEPVAPHALIDHGVPLFLQQLADTLRLEATTRSRDSEGPVPAPAPTDIGRAAAFHGAEMLRRGHSIDQVVHEYGDVCQAVTDLAVEQKLSVGADEFRTLNRCLDNAIADAVTAFGRSRQATSNLTSEDLHKRLQVFGDEHRRLVAIAVQALSAIRTGNVGLSGATGSLLTHTLDELHFLTERSLPEIRLASAATTVLA